MIPKIINVLKDLRKRVTKNETNICVFNELYFSDICFKIKITINCSDFQITI